MGSAQRNQTESEEAMKLQIVSRDFEVTDSINYHIEKNTRDLLAWNWSKVNHIRVTIGDTNGPRGGVDKYCRVIIDLVAGEVVTVEKVAESLYTAISHASEVAERRALAVISRERQRRRWRGLGVIF